MHHMYVEKTYREKDGGELYKNAWSRIEQILEATTHETAAVRPLTPISKTIEISRERYSEHCWRSKK